MLLSNKQLLPPQPQNIPKNKTISECTTQCFLCGENTDYTRCNDKNINWVRYVYVQTH